MRLQKKGESRTIYDAGWSSLVARRAHNPEVVGSNPTPATMGARRNCLSAHHFFQFTISCPSCPGLLSANNLLTEENAASTAAENFRPSSLIA